MLLCRPARRTSVVLASSTHNGSALPLAGKKKCKKDKNTCKKSCESKFKCSTSCEDNTIPGFGSWWCELNAPEPSFCSNEAQKKKCKKTCGLCG